MDRASLQHFAFRCSLPFKSVLVPYTSARLLLSRKAASAACCALVIHMPFMCVRHVLAKQIVAVPINMALPGCDRDVWSALAPRCGLKPQPALA